MTENELKRQYEEEMVLYDQYQKEVGSQEAEPIAEVPPYSDTGMDTLSDAAVSIPQGITSWADEIQAGAQALGRTPELANPAAFEGMPQSEGPSFMEKFDEEVKPIRERLSLARERSPWASAGTELATGIGTAFIPGLGAGKLSSAAGMIGRGAVEGLGTSNDKMSMEGLTNTGIGAGLGAGGALVSGGLKKLSTVDPNAVRANILGAGSSEFKEISLKERKAIAQELKDMGLFQNNKVDFSVSEGKFVSRGKSLENIEKPVREKLFERLDSATAKIQDEKMALLGKHSNDTIDLEDLEKGLEAVVEKYSKKATDMPGRKETAEELKRKIIEDILEDLEEEGLDHVTIGMVERAKQRISEDVGNYGKNPSLQKTPDTAQLYQSMYTEINKKLRNQLGNTKYAKYNDMQQKMLTAKTDLSKSIASENANKASAGWGGWGNKIMNATIGSPEAGLGIANTAETLQKVPFRQGMRGLRTGVQEAPFESIRQLDPSIPEYLQRPNDRTPQSQGSTMITPKQMVQYRIPRTTQGILDNKEMVMGKLIQNGIPDEMIEMVAQALDSDQEALSDIAPLIISQFPTLFEKSKYQVFDGIIAPTDRPKAADAISKKEDMNSIQRAKAINDINKSGKFPQELA